MLLLACVLLAIGCIPARGTAPPSRPRPTLGPTGPTRFGLISDSQITTLLARGWTPLYSGPIEDRVARVARRPPASDVYAVDLLRDLLQRIGDAEIVLYLGDAANNGCADELRTAFDVLTELQRAGRPVFFVIGNHDYLGAGNTTNPPIRAQLCGSGTPLSKWDLIQMAERLNTASANLVGLEYESSFRTLDPARCSAPAGHIGCFYAARLGIPQRREEVLLVDTSDYEQDWLPGVPAYWGLTGHLSRPQVDWLTARSGRIPQTTRIIASHYPTSDIHYLPALADVQGIRAVAGGGATPPAASCWFSAHTHDAAPQLRAGNTLELNIGSSRDWEPHAAVASCTGGSVVHEARFARTPSCDRIQQIMQAEAATATYTPVSGHGDAESIFGVNGLYREVQFDPIRDIDAIQANLNRLLGVLAASGISQQEAKVCIAWKAAERER